MSMAGTFFSAAKAGEFMGFFEIQCLLQNSQKLTISSQEFSAIIFPHKSHIFSIQ